MSTDWISVDDELPPPDVEVLCTDMGSGRHFEAFHCRKSGWLRNNGGSYLRPYVTHWQELPSPPRK